MGAKILKSERASDLKGKLDSALIRLPSSKFGSDAMFARALLEKLDAGLLLNSAASDEAIAMFLVNWVAEWILWHPGWGKVASQQAKRLRNRNEKLLSACHRFYKDLEKYNSSAGLPKGGDDSILETPVGTGMVKVAFSLGQLEEALGQLPDPMGYGGSEYDPKDDLALSSAELSTETFGGKPRWTLLSAMYNVNLLGGPRVSMTPEKLQTQYCRAKKRSNQKANKHSRKK